MRRNRGLLVLGLVGLSSVAAVPVVAAGAGPLESARSTAGLLDANPSPPSFEIHPSRSAREERVRSRVAFRDASPAQALSIARREHRSVAVDPLWRAPALGKRERIVRFDSPTSAVVALGGTKERSRLEAVGVPMAAGPLPGRSAASSELKPVDLSLRGIGEGWRPERSAVATTLPRDSGGRIGVGKELSVGIDGHAHGKRTARTKVFYAEIETDTDAVVEPVADGVSVSWLLRSPGAPDRLRLDLDGASASGVRIQGDGSLTLRGADGPIGTISTPLAWDADGITVPTRFVRDGGQVSVAVDHRRRDLTYPIAVDPVVQLVGSSGAILEQDDSFGTPARPTLAGWLHHTFQPPSFEFTEESTQKTITALGTGDGSAWFSFDPIRNSAPYKVQFAGVRFARQGAGSGTCQRLGIVNLDLPDSWMGSKSYKSWSGDYTPGGPTPWNSTPAPPPTGQGSGPYGDCVGGAKSSFVEVCATSSCEPVGQSTSIVAFQLNATQVQPGAWSRSTFSGAYVYHRENNVPTGVIKSTNWNPADWSTFADGLKVGVAVHDDGVGLCGDASTGFPPVVQLLDPDVQIKDPLEPPRSVASAGNDGCTGETFDRPAPSDHDYDLEVPSDAVPEGRRTMVMTIRDAVGNTIGKVLKFRADRSAPEIALSGELYARRETEIPGAEQRPLTILATDGSTASPLTARSGVQRIEVYVDDELVHEADQAGVADSAPLSTTWVPEAGRFEVGGYTVRVVAYDRLDHEQEMSFTVKGTCCGVPLGSSKIPTQGRRTVFGDFDGDGASDIALVDRTTGALGVRSGLADGTFADEHPWGTFGTAVSDVAAGDVSGPAEDEEGRPSSQTDDLVARTAAGALVTRVSSGATFTNPTPVSDTVTQRTWPAGRSLELADVDGDGQSDLWGIDAGSRDLAIAYSRGTSFRTAWTAGTVATGTTTKVSDLDGDVLADIATYAPADGSVRFAQSDGTSFAAPDRWGTGPPNVDAAFGDVNGDGTTDAVFREPSGGVIGRVTEDEGLTTESRDLGDLDPTFDLRSLDINGDGADDVVGVKTVGQTLEIKVTGSGVQPSAAADGSAVDPDPPGDASLARREAAPKKAELMMSDDNALWFRSGLGPGGRPQLLAMMKHLGATKVRTILWWGKTDRLHPDDEGTLKLAPGEPDAAPPAATPAGRPPVPQSETKPPTDAAARRVILARDEATTPTGTVDDPRPEWIPNGQPGKPGFNAALAPGGEWVVVKNRYYVSRLNEVLSAIKAAGMSAHVTVSGGGRSWTECSAYQNEALTTLQVRGCRTEPDPDKPGETRVRMPTGESPDPKRAAHFIAGITEYMKSRPEYGSAVQSIGVWNEPNDSGSVFFSHRNGAGEQLNRAGLYGQIYARAWEQFNRDCGKLTPTKPQPHCLLAGEHEVRIAFGELASGKTSSSAYGNSSSLRVQWPDSWAKRALTAAKSEIAWPGSRVRTDIFAIHPYGHRKQPWKQDRKFPWGIDGVARSISRGKGTKVRTPSVKSFLTESVDDRLRKQGASSAVAPLIWATEFGYYAVKAPKGRLTWNRMEEAHHEDERARWMTYRNESTGTKGALPSLAEDGNAKVIGLWEILENPPWQLTPNLNNASLLPGKRLRVNADYGFVGSSEDRSEEGVTESYQFKTRGGVTDKNFDSWSKPLPQALYLSQTMRIRGSRTYGKAPGSRPKKNPAKDASQDKKDTWERFHGLQWTQRRKVACAIRDWRGLKTAAEPTLGGTQVCADPTTKK